MELPHGRSRYRHHGCRCEVCVEANRLYMRELRARKRTLTPLAPVAAQDEPLATVANETVEPGPCVRAVRAELDGLGLAGYEGEQAAAICMAHILDNPGAVTTQPAACRQLVSLLERLHKVADVPRRRLEAVTKMVRSSRPDAGA
jgi:hypothetical protein